MGSILVVTPKPEDANRIANMIRQGGVYTQVNVCLNGNEVLRKVHDQDVGLVVCTKRLTDMGYEELSTYLPAHVNMLLVTKDAGLLPFSSNIVHLLLPFRSEELMSTIRMLLPDVFVKPKKRMKSEEEMKLIGQAKQILMERNNMSEPDAFRYIQKNSMDSGRTMKESAEMIIALNSG